MFVEFSSFLAIENFTCYFLTYFNKGFISVVISMYLSFISTNQVTFSMHSSVVLIGASVEGGRCLSFICFTLDDRTLMK